MANQRNRKIKSAFADEAAQELEQIKRAKTGDIVAFEELVIQYREQAVRFANSIVHDSFYAEDMVQESFAKAYLHLSTFQIKPFLKHHSTSPFRSWLFAIVRNQCVDYLRREPQEDELKEDWEQGSKELDPQEMIERKERWEDIVEQFQMLTPEARTALYLYSMEDMSYQEIAEVLDKNIPQIKMMIYRARKKLKTKGAGKHDR